MHFEGKCPYCGKNSLEREMVNPFRSLSGIVRCTNCTYKDGLQSYIARSLIYIEPLPPGAQATYDKDIDIAAVIMDETEEKRVRCNYVRFIGRSYENV